MLYLGNKLLVIYLSSQKIGKNSEKVDHRIDRRPLTNPIRDRLNVSLDAATVAFHRQNGLNKKQMK
jgi:hypothetical protein